MDSRKHGRGKDSSLRVLLLAAPELVELVRVTQRALNHGDVHLADNTLGCGTRRWAVASAQLELPHREEVEDVVVELGHA